MFTRLDRSINEVVSCDLKQIINDVSQVSIAKNKNEKVKSSIKNYSEAIYNPNKVEVAGMFVRPKGELLYRGESIIEVCILPIERRFEVTQDVQIPTFGDLFILKALQVDSAFGFGCSEAIKRIFKNKNIYDIRLKFNFNVCYNMEINKHRAAIEITLVEDDILNQELSVDERMLIELASQLTYGFLAKINKLKEPLTEKEIFNIQEEYKKINLSFIEYSKGEQGVKKNDQHDDYEVITRNVGTDFLIDDDKTGNVELLK